MPVNFEFYKIFDAIARHKNISRAAEELCLSRVTVTQELRSLEKQLGLTLFQRHSRGVRMTPEGEALFRRVSPAVDALKAAEQQAISFGRLEQGTLRVSYNGQITQQAFQEIVAGFQARYPGITIQSSLIGYWSVREALDAGVVDLSIGTRPADLSLRMRRNPSSEPSRDITEYRLGVFEDVFVVHRHLEWLTARPLCLRELANYPFIFWRDRSSPRAAHYLDQLEDSRGMRGTVERDLFPGDLGTIFALLKTGDYIANVPYLSLLSPYAAGGDYLPLRITDPPLSTEYLLHFSKSAPMSLAAAKLAEHLLSYDAFHPEEIPCSV